MSELGVDFRDLFGAIGNGPSFGFLEEIWLRGRVVAGGLRAGERKLRGGSYVGLLKGGINFGDLFALIRNGPSFGRKNIVW